MKHESKNLIIFIFNFSGSNIICTVNPGSEGQHKNNWHATIQHSLKFIYTKNIYHASNFKLGLVLIINKLLLCICEVDGIPLEPLFVLKQIIFIISAIYFYFLFFKLNWQSAGHSSVETRVHVQPDCI